MNSVFMVSHGEYSDYTVDGLFSTRELAQKWVDESKIAHEKYYSYSLADDYYYIDEWRIDDEAGFKARKCYHTVINWVNGNLETHPESVELAHPNASSRSDYDDEWLVTNKYPLVSACSFISQDHANKLAVELRQKILRLKGLENVNS